MTNIRVWKKVFENDLDYIVGELKDLLKFPALIILTGDLGSGKTTLVKKIASTLGQSKEKLNAVSPSYSLINDYGNILHADFYRLKNIGELEHLELSMYLEGKDIFLVEWGREFVQGLLRELPENIFCYEIQIDFMENNANSSRHYQLNQITE
jgi:tRNA threonylcarbamoyladenosine biosynthesis protein TsaE